MSSIRRFPEEIREELNSLINRSSWQSLTREFSVDILTNLRVEALDNIADFVDSDYPEFQENVRKRLGILKKKSKEKRRVLKARVGWDFTVIFTGIIFAFTAWVALEHLVKFTYRL